MVPYYSAGQIRCLVLNAKGQKSIISTDGLQMSAQKNTSDEGSASPRPSDDEKEPTIEETQKQKVSFYCQAQHEHDILRE